MIDGDPGASDQGWVRSGRDVSRGKRCITRDFCGHIKNTGVIINYSNVHDKGKIRIRREYSENPHLLPLIDKRVRSAG